MVCLRATPSPGSFQLRLAFRCNRAPASLLHLRTNFRLADRRVCCSSDSVRSTVRGDGSEGSGARTSSGNSWTNSSSKEDLFSGWFDKDSRNPEWNRGFEGVAGAGLAGIFLAGVIAFASASLIKRGPNKQMEPMTIQQEQLLASEHLDENFKQGGNESDAASAVDEGPNDRDSAVEGIDQDPFSSIEITESRSDDKVHFGSSLLQNNESNNNGIDTINNALSQDAVSVANGPKSNTSDMLKSDAGNCSSDAFTLTESLSSTSSDVKEPFIELNESQEIIEIVNSPSSDLTNLSKDLDDGIFFSAGTENSNVRSELVTAPIDKLPSNPLVLDESMASESNATQESHFNFKDVVETVGSMSGIKKVESSETLESHIEGTNIPSEEQNLIADEPPGTFSTSISEGIYESEKDTGRSLPKSPLPDIPFSFAGIPAPSIVSVALQAPPGKVLVPAVVDQVQGQALSALQDLKVIEADVKSGDLCTRREYARWLVSASSALSRNTISKVYPAMYIENVTELAFDDVSPEDPDFPSIQGLAEAGLISSKLSRQDMHHSIDGEKVSVFFSPESPLSRQDLVSWKMVIERKQLPEADRKILSQCSGFIDIDKIHPDAWPAIVADLSSGDHGIIALAFGFTRLFQPEKPVTKAQAAIALATGDASELVSEEVARIEAESMAETAVATHAALVAHVEKELNAGFEKDLAMEREKIDTMEELAEEARLELDRLRSLRDKGNSALSKGHAVIDSELEILTRLRHDMEEQLQGLMSDKTEISFLRDRINRICEGVESENQAIAKLLYDLEVERKALAMARSWAEGEAKRVREHATALKEARDRREMHGIKVVVDDDLRADATAGASWLNFGKQSPMMEETLSGAENLVDKLKTMASEVKGTSAVVIEKIIQRVICMISYIKQKVAETARTLKEHRQSVASKSSRSIEEFQRTTAGLSSNVRDGAKRLVEDCKDNVEKICHKFKI